MLIPVSPHFNQNYKALIEINLSGKAIDLLSSSINAVVLKK
jgi:hypothetical protein